jgi:hypothetical protein
LLLPVLLRTDQMSSVCCDAGSPGTTVGFDPSLYISVRVRAKVTGSDNGVLGERVLHVDLGVGDSSRNAAWHESRSTWWKRQRRDVKATTD